MTNRAWRNNSTLGLVGLGLCLLAIACRSTEPSDTRHAKKTANPNPTPSPALASTVDSGVVRTNFTATVKPDEQVQVHLDLARMYELRGHGDAAIYEYQKAIDASGSQEGRHLSRRSPELAALAHRRMAGVLDRAGRFAQAEVHYKKAIELNSKDAKIWNDAGYSAYLQGRWAEAEGRLKTAARLAPSDNRIQTNLGLCLAASGKTQEALEALSRAGGPAVGHANLGYLLASMGKHEEARSHYNQALALQPKLEAARAALAQIDLQSAAAAAAPGLAAARNGADVQITRAAAGVAAPPEAIGTVHQIPLHSEPPVEETTDQSPKRRPRLRERLFGSR